MKKILTFGATLAALILVGGCTSVRHGNRTVELFNGRDLAGWKHVLADPAVPRDAVWWVREGILICKGEPLGVLHTEDSYTDFRLFVEYRWAPGSVPGNSGVFSRIHSPARALPRCAEVQLKHGSAGDVITLHGMKLAPDQPRFFEIKNHQVAGDINGVKKLADVEKPPGEWNQVEILARQGNYTVWINGRKVNDVRGVDVLAGPVGLQSEGGEIHFRRAALTPLP